MAFRPRTWQPVAVALCVLNFLGGVAAAFSAEPWHATTHAVAAVAFGYWGSRLRDRRRREALRDPLEALAELDELEFSLIRVRAELAETQERLTLAERLLTTAPVPRRADPER